MSADLRSGTAFPADWPADLAETYFRAGHWRNANLAEEFHATSIKHAEHTAVVDGRTRLTHRDLDSHVRRVAGYLHDVVGLEQGDTILVALPNSWEFLAVALGAIRAGVVPTLALPAHGERELTAVAQEVGAKAFVAPTAWGGRDYLPLAERLRSGVKSLDHILLTGSATQVPWLDASPYSTGPQHLAPPGAPALLLLSGGTTGTPKVVPRSHVDYECYLRAVTQASALNPTTVNLTVLPLAHNFQLGNALGTLLAGGQVVIATSGEPGVAMRLINEERVTLTSVVPTIAQRWLAHRHAILSGPPETLNVLVIGGAHVPDGLGSELIAAFGCTLQQGYGMAEGLVTTTRLDDSVEICIRTQGRPICEADEIRIVSASGDLCGSNSIGSLETRGPYTVRSYYRSSNDSDDAFTPDGWYRTGDLALVRPDGNIVVTGREKDVINRAGEIVGATEIEDLASSHADVLMAASVPVPDATLGEAILLYVVSRDGVPLTLDDVHSVMANSKLARYKWPDRLIVVPYMPLTPIGKIDKTALQALFPAGEEGTSVLGDAAAAVTGDWSITSRETSRSSGREVLRTGVFTFAADGSGTVETSQGFRGTIAARGGPEDLSVEMSHVLPRGWTATGHLHGSVTPDRLSLVGTVTVTTKGGDVVDTSDAVMAGTRNLPQHVEGEA